MLEKLSMYDGLTNIRNRRYFDETFEKTFNEIKREKSLAVLMIDIDFSNLITITMVMDKEMRL